VVARILSISLNTFRENLREKLLYNLLIFALLMIGSSILLSRLTLGDYHRLILDLGLASINIFGVLIAIFVGISLVSKEIDKKTIYTIISKPVPRYAFLLGKYLGLVITLLANTIVMIIGLLIVLQVMDVPITALLFKSLAMIFIELMVITAVALLFSTFTSSTLSAIFPLAIYVIGHLSADLKTFGDKLETMGRGVVNALYYVMPNLERFNLKGHVTNHVDVPTTDLLLTLAYGLSYTAMLLLLSAMIFQRRDFQ
jgi:ABC-type transport system involved in multi-copper enzyme maturation permease subunit